VDSLATWSLQLALSFGCADKGLSGAGRHYFYLALPDRPLLTFAQSSSAARELPRHSGGFHVRSGRGTPTIWHSPAGPKQRLSTKKTGLDDKELAFESSPGSVREWRQRSFQVTVERLGGDLAALVYHAAATRFGVAGAAAAMMAVNDHVVWVTDLYSPTGTPSRMASLLTASATGKPPPQTVTAATATSPISEP
jgi:hypothetical protein